MMLRADLHIHTVMSGHAFCTVNECIATAQSKGLSLIAITDHGPSMEHSAHEGYFEMATRLPKHVGSLDVLFGCEMNIIDINGNVDLSANTMAGLDIVLAGLHKRTPYYGNSESDNTTAIIKSIQSNRDINVITHPYRAEFPVSINDVVHASMEYGVLLEVNASLLMKAIHSPKDRKNQDLIQATVKMVDILQGHNKGFIISSDAHYSTEIGICDSACEVLYSAIGILPTYVLNDKLDLLKTYIPSIEKREAQA